MDDVYEHSDVMDSIVFLLKFPLACDLQLDIDADII